MLRNIDDVYGNNEPINSLCIRSITMENETTYLKVNEMDVNSKNVNTTVKVLEIGEPKNIISRFGDRQVSEAKVADETGCILMSLWNEQIEKVNVNDVLSIINGYISVVGTSMRLNIGKYGKMEISDETLDEVNTSNNVSDKVIERPRRSRGRRYDTKGSGGRGGQKSRWR